MWGFILLITTLSRKITIDGKGCLSNTQMLKNGHNLEHDWK
jgi:hypothetical protein